MRTLQEQPDAGLQTGVYFYSQATSAEEAQEEADFVLDQLGGRKLDLPITFDHEKDTTVNARGNNVDRDTLTAAALAFCQRIEQAGYRSMVYGNKVDIARMNLDSLGDRPVWFAEYNALQLSGQFDFVLWQYSNTGSVARHFHPRRHEPVLHRYALNAKSRSPAKPEANFMC